MERSRIGQEPERSKVTQRLTEKTQRGTEGEYANPGAGYTYTDCLVLMGRWKADGSLAWTISERIVGDPNRSTRGMIEPTIAELADGSILMVMRGSNDARPELPGHKWMARSRDGGQSWTAPEPWTYTDGCAPVRGQAFYSPSACPQLLPHSSGRLLWAGNINEHNPAGNRPRYPLVLGEVDRTSGLLIRDSATVVDERRPGEDERLTLSNFYAREDRETGEMLLHLPRFFARGEEGGWTTDLSLLRIRCR